MPSIAELTRGEPCSIYKRPGEEGKAGGAVLGRPHEPRDLGPGITDSDRDRRDWFSSSPPFCSPFCRLSLVLWRECCLSLSSHPCPFLIYPLQSKRPSFPKCKSNHATPQPHVCLGSEIQTSECSLLTCPTLALQDYLLPGNKHKTKQKPVSRDWWANRRVPTYIKV